MSSETIPPGHYVIAVDDDPVMRDLVTQYLTRAGFSVVPCSNGAEMWASLAHYPARVVVLDVNMPGEDGLGLAEGIRAKYGFGVSVIMLTGDEGETVRAVAYNAGVEEFMTKPCDWARLVAMVTRLSAVHGA